MVLFFCLAWFIVPSKSRWSISIVCVHSVLCSRLYFYFHFLGCRFLGGFLISPVCVIMGIMHDTMVLIVCIFLNCWFPAMDRIIWYADYIFPLTSCIWEFIFACVFKLHLVQREGWHIIEGPSFRNFPFRFLDVVAVCYFIVYVGFLLIFRCLPGLFPSSA